MPRQLRKLHPAHSASLSSTTRSPKTSIAPARSPRRTSASNGSSSAACGVRTSPNSTQSRSTTHAQILQKYKLRVTDIASPLFKTDWPGAPLSKHSPKHDQFHADFDFKQQDILLQHCIELTKAFNTDRIRCFDFWRLDDVKPYREAMNKKLTEAAETCAKHNIILLLENEMACNTGTGEEAAAVLAAIPNKNFMLNWDPGNAGTFPGNIPYPNGYDSLPKDRIGHCHCKDVKRDPNGKFEWEPVGGGIIDWVGQFRALKAQGYHYAVSLETHWRGAGTPEASTRISMKGLKDALQKAGITC